MQAVFTLRRNIQERDGGLHLRNPLKTLHFRQSERIGKIKALHENGLNLAFASLPKEA